MHKQKGIWLLLVIIATLLMTGTVWGAAGDLLWEKQFTFPPINLATPTIGMYAITASPTCVIVCGNAGVMNTFGFIKAFDAATGDLKWEFNLDLSVDPMDFSKMNMFISLRLESGILLANGIASYQDPSTPGVTKNVTFLGAFNPDTGQPLWQVQKDYIGFLPGTYNPYSPTPLTAAANNRVFLAVSDPVLPAAMGSTSCTIRAFQIKNVALQNSLLLDKGSH